MLLLPFSDYMVVSALLGAFVLILFLYTNRRKRDPRYPPGPWALPLIGNVIQIGSRPYIAFAKWTKKYGPIFSLKLGMDDVVVVTDPTLTKELLSENVSGGRLRNEVFSVYGGGIYGIINSEGPLHEEQRRFTLRKLKEFGLTKSCLETPILDEVNSMMNFLERKSGSPLPVRRLFNGAITNTLWNIISGERNEWDMPEQPLILAKLEAAMLALNRTMDTGLMFLPSMRYIAPEWSGWRNWVHTMKELTDLAGAAVTRHISKLNLNMPQDFIDHYLLEIRNHEVPTSSFYKEMGEENLRTVVMDLFVAGSETTTTTLEWALVYLSHCKNAQRKLQAELDKIIGTSNLPSLSDKPSLPYTEAVLMETLRLSTVLPLGGPRRMMEDLVFHGHFLPKDTIILPSVHNILHDPRIWGDDANEFRPERFLSDDETKVVRNEALLPFGFGKRQCIGESLAKDTLFLFIAAIFQRFDISMDPSCSNVDFEPNVGFVLFPKPFKIVVKKRI